MTAAAINEMSHGKCRHGCKTSDVDGDCVELIYPIESRIGEASSSRDDNQIDAACLSDHLTDCCLRVGDVVQINTSDGRDSCMLRGHLPEGLDASRGDSNRITATCQLYSDGSADS